MAAVVGTIAAVGAIATGVGKAISGYKAKKAAKNKQAAAEAALKEAQNGLKNVQ